MAFLILLSPYLHGTKLLSLKDASKLSSMLAQVRATALQEKVISFDELPPQHITPSLMWSLLQNNAKNVRIRLLSLRRGQTCHNCGKKGHWIGECLICLCCNQHFFLHSTQHCFCYYIQLFLLILSRVSTMLMLLFPGTSFCYCN